MCNKKIITKKCFNCSFFIFLCCFQEFLKYVLNFNYILFKISPCNIGTNASNKFSEPSVIVSLHFDFPSLIHLTCCCNFFSYWFSDLKITDLYTLSCFGTKALCNIEVEKKDRSPVFF